MGEKFKVGEEYKYKKGVRDGVASSSAAFPDIEELFLKLYRCRVLITL